MLAADLGVEDHLDQQRKSPPVFDLCLHEIGAVTLVLTEHAVAPQLREATYDERNAMQAR